jgi:phosphatidate cytidylyltransferase
MLLVSWPAALLLLLALALRRPPAEAVPGAAATLLGAAYLGTLGGAVAALRLADPVATGAWRVTLLLGAVMSADTCAYLVGRALGRRRLAPALSPSKTLEGLGGALMGGALGALVVRALGLPELPASHAAALGIAAAAAGTVGDLFESQLKRWAGVKDSGALFPGHGGMLDRLDSLLFAAPVLYYYFVGRS